MGLRGVIELVSGIGVFEILRIYQGMALQPGCLAKFILRLELAMSADIHLCSTAKKEFAYSLRLVNTVKLHSVDYLK